jgi:hypothetical protein
MSFREGQVRIAPDNYQLDHADNICHIVTELVDVLSELMDRNPIKD